MAFGRLMLAWAAVAAWLGVWALGERLLAGTAFGRREAVTLGGEALLLALFAALWFGSLGAGTWWLVFLLLGALMEWPIRSRLAAVRIARIVGAGGILAWVLPS